MDSVGGSAGLASGHGVGQGVKAGSMEAGPKGGALGGEDSAAGGEGGARSAEGGPQGNVGGPQGNVGGPQGNVGGPRSAEGGPRVGRRGFLNEGAGILAKEGASETATRPAAAAMSPEEAAVVAAVERCFKGSLVAVSDAATAGDSASSIVQVGSRSSGAVQSSPQRGPAQAGLSESSEPNASVISSDERTKISESEASDKGADEDSFYSEPSYDEPF